jgi:hypothetical protein
MSHWNINIMLGLECVLINGTVSLSTHSVWRRVPILYQMRNCQHILSGGVCVYGSTWETVNTFSLEACAYTIPNENLSTHSVWRRVCIRFQLRNCQHILSGSVCLYYTKWETVNTFSLEACAYTIPNEKLSTHSVWRRVPILYEMRNFQHILSGSVCLYYTKWETVNTFSLEACAYTVPNEKLSTHSLWRRVPILYQIRNCQHILSGGVCLYYTK